jgi:UDP-N-acetylglucosamine diphosphorylase/glucosamine-1-phosphate N-acetyltransferase
MREIAVVILAAGKGTRMAHDTLPKVLVSLCGKPLLDYVLETTQSIQPAKIIAVVGYLKDKIFDFCETNYPNVQFAIQEHQLGTGHAISQAEGLLNNFSGDVLILAGDVPLISNNTIEKFIIAHTLDGNTLSVLSTKTDNPFGYGRIVRDNDSSFLKIVEQKDANDTEKAITEINSGVYLVKSDKLFYALRQLKNNNSQGEFYLTDIVQILRNESYKTSAYCLAEFAELQGINSQEDLSKVEAFLNNTPKV